MHCALDKKEEALDVNSSWHIDRVVGVGIDHIGHRSAKISKDCKGCYSLCFFYLLEQYSYHMDFRCIRTGKCIWEYD